jgi:hypothetical protein
MKQFYQKLNENFPDDRNYLSFSGVPEKGYFEEFINNDEEKRLKIYQKLNANFPDNRSYLSVPEISESVSTTYLQTFVDNIRINTDIDFVSKTNSFSENDLRYLTSSFLDKSLSLELPSKFNWAKTTLADSPDVVAKKLLIAKPDNQYLCGSCWAVAVAGVVGDVFAVAGLVNWLPDISATYALVHYPQDRCRGGDPAELLNTIARYGIPSKHCVDYSWCSKNKTCTTADSALHFGSDLSTLIPKEKGCYYDSEHYVFKIDSNIKTIVAGSGAVDVSNVQRTIKEHIYTVGPTVVGFILFKNFLAKVKNGPHKGNAIFNTINGGVYLEKANYNSYNGPYGLDTNEGASPGLTFSSINTDSDNFAGGHAVAVMGWGVQPQIKVGNDPNDIADVPYWYCRNSWGTKWGMNGGYFKIAMYPYNRKSQFSKYVEMMTPRGVLRLGGVLAFTASKPPDLKKLPTYSQPPIANSLNRSIDFYKTDEDNIVSKIANIVPPLNVTTDQEKNNWYIYILIIIFVIIILFFIRRKR